VRLCTTVRPPWPFCRREGKRRKLKEKRKEKGKARKEAARWNAGPSSPLFTTSSREVKEGGGKQKEKKKKRGRKKKERNDPMTSRVRLPRAALSF